MTEYSYDEKYNAVCKVMDKSSEKGSNDDLIDLLFRFFVNRGLIQIEKNGSLKIKTLKEMKKKNA